MSEQESGEIEPRKFPVECRACGNPFDAHNDGHFVLTDEERPVPDKEDMVFDDWITSNYYICQDCGTELIGSENTDPDTPN